LKKEYEKQISGLNEKLEEQQEVYDQLMFKAQVAGGVLLAILFIFVIIKLY
jgi:hypothetical protein